SPTSSITRVSAVAVVTSCPGVSRRWIGWKWSRIRSDAKGRGWCGADSGQICGLSNGGWRGLDQRRSCPGFGAFPRYGLQQFDGFGPGAHRLHPSVPTVRSDAGQGAIQVGFLARQELVLADYHRDFAEVDVCEGDRSVIRISSP